MRAGLRAIQQTLTPEAAGVLNDSIAEAGRRNHGQTTPLHVAATLLASPSGFLRQACIRSHPNSSHPLQCRALELCFSVALDRLATAQTQIQSPSEPPVSNALMAALKRAQAIQRRGCPDQQQQPLLAVKVELDQLIISILDDPSVSRVMREASFSSPAVKAKIEQAVIKSTSHGNPKHQLAMPIFLNPSPAFQLVNAREEEVKRALEIMLRLKKRNPILVGDGEPQAVVKDLLKKIESKELGSLMNVKVVSMEKGMLLSNKDQITEKMKELGGIIEGTIGNGGVILALGDLKWLVEQPMVLEMQRVVIMEMSKLLARFRGEEGDEGSKLWFIGTATCETYLRCQVYHSTMETDWDLQAVPVATKSPFPRIFPGFGTEKLWRGPGEPMNPTRTISTPLQQPLFARHISDMQDSCQRATFCPQCSENYKREVSAIEKSLSEATQPSLPAWLQNANLNSNQSQGKENGVLSEQKTQELRKKWRDTCLHLHPNYYQTSHCDRSSPPMLSTTGLYNPNLLPHLIFPPKFPAVKPLGQALQLNTAQTTCQQTRITNSPPGSPVRTDLVLGRKETESTPDMGDQAKDFLGCISPGTTYKLCDKFTDASEVDTHKKLVKGLMEKAWWQEEAASAVASAVTTWKLGNGKRQGSGSRGDIWLLFMGPDRVGKKKMALVLAEQICGVSPVVMSLGTHRCTDEMNTNSRGKTAIDRIVDAVQRNPFLVIMLEDMNETDNLVRRNIKNAIESGRLADSHGREVSLGNTIFILTGDWSTIHPEALGDSQFVNEAKVASIASSNCCLGLTVREKCIKRSASWLPEDDRPLKPRKELRSTLSLDLRLSAADANDEDNVDGSYNSSDVTVDHEDEPNNPVNQQFSITSVAHDLINNVDESVVFKPVSLAFALGKIKKAISLKFSTIMDDNLSLEVEENVLEMILGGVWHDRTSLDEWIGNVLEPSFHQLKGQLRSGERMSSVVRLVVVPESGNRSKSKCKGDWLPSSILV